MSWDIFDVMKEFDPAIWDDNRLNREIPDLAQLKKRAKGAPAIPRAGYTLTTSFSVAREADARLV